MQQAGDVRPRHMEIENRLMSRWGSGETPRGALRKNRRRIGEAQSAKV